MSDGTRKRRYKDKIRRKWYADHRARRWSQTFWCGHFFCECEITCKKDEETIRYRAYLKWERAGRPQGEDQKFWFEAEKELLAA